MLVGHYLAKVAFDSGPLDSKKKERADTWTNPGETAVSQRNTEQEIQSLPRDTFDQ